MLDILYLVVHWIIKATVFITALGLEAYSDYASAEYLTLAASGATMKTVMWYVGTGLGVARFFLSAISFTEITHKITIGATSRAACSIMLTVASVIFGIGYFDSASDNLLKDSYHAERALKERDQKINAAQKAIDDFDTSSSIDIAAYKKMLAIDKATPAINANNKRKEERRKLVEKLNEALSIPCEKAPDIGQLNKMYIGVTQFFYSEDQVYNKNTDGEKVEWLKRKEETFNKNMKKIRSRINAFISLLIDFTALNMLVKSGFGGVINTCFPGTTKRQQEPAINPDSQPDSSPPQPDSSLDSLNNKPDSLDSFPPKNERITPPFQSPKPTIYTSKPLTVLGGNRTHTGLIKKAEPDSQPDSLDSSPDSLDESRDEEYEKILDYVRDFKRLYPKENCGVNKVYPRFGIRKDRASKFFERGLFEGYFYKRGQLFEPTEKLLNRG